jgi:hypothetical protein
MFDLPMQLSTRGGRGYQAATPPGDTKIDLFHLSIRLAMWDTVGTGASPPPRPASALGFDIRDMPGAVRYHRLHRMGPAGAPARRTHRRDDPCQMIEDEQPTAA